ncbi:MAG TPA: hypothetical protein VE913_06245 [Longimicrobium sp.]|nr:hypothetical protein [Longimicrobium sp.]
MALCVGASLLSACADDGPTTRSAGSAGNASVRETALRDLRNGGSPDAVEQAVATLGDLPRVTAADVAEVAETSREGADATIKISAIRVMQQWLDRDPLRDAAARELMRTARGPHQPMVRGVAMQAVALHPRASWPKDVVVALGELVRTDPTAQNRSIASLALGQVRGELATTALASLVAAYEAEPDLGTRRSMLLNIVEVAGADAAGVLGSLPEGSALAQQDIADYQAILRSGATDPAAIWDAKLARDIARGSVIGTEDGNDRN